MKNPQMNEWPYDKIFRQNDGVVKMQMLITYEVRDGRLISRFYGKDDYQDSVSTEVLV
jgi:hypothetical protein